jgi:hypothetical protein
MAATNLILAIGVMKTNKEPIDTLCLCVCVSAYKRINKFHVSKISLYLLEITNTMAVRNSEVMSLKAYVF